MHPTSMFTRGKVCSGTRRAFHKLLLLGIGNLTVIQVVLPIVSDLFNRNSEVSGVATVDSWNSSSILSL